MVSVAEVIVIAYAATPILAAVDYYTQPKPRVTTFSDYWVLTLMEITLGVAGLIVGTSIRW